MQKYNSKTVAFVLDVLDRRYPNANATVTVGKPTSDITKEEPPLLTELSLSKGLKLCSVVD